ncbi:molybdenum cofactor guanylyltransferase [Sporosarcina sp. ANT_H38]|uniref:molybdenum cofactor guanylyltransferase n=1 Tax=Sporosarcina sp. ANT_H38 TaxID=2597358 RepID=UPI0011F1DB6D|nr:molybdenum cofactor guanylyltransferase [Sporosarcina sp. ANT_H38]KAA0955777.1 molybdenum cofactor guanylyltransferase [Sporosarcina sp. ANT_H38]
MTKTVGIVLAGGVSRRFGFPKALAKLGDQHFYELAVGALSVCCDEVIIVTRPEYMEHFPSCLKTMTDLAIYAGLGPLAGILSVMESVEADRYAVLPCDMPHVNSQAMTKLLVHHEKGVTGVISDGRYHPLVSIWDGHLKSAVKEALINDQLSVMKLLSSQEAVWITGNNLTDDENRMFMNVNTPEDLEGE